MMNRNDVRYRFVSASGGVLATIRFDAQEDVYIAKVEVSGVEYYKRCDSFDIAKACLLEFIDDISDSLTYIGAELMDAEEDEDA